MYALLNEEQFDLKATVDSLVLSVGVANPGDLQDRDPAHAWAQLRQMGLLELRRRDGGVPLASGVEVMVVAQSLASGLVPIPFLPSAVLATELLSLARAPAGWLDDATEGAGSYGLLLRPDLTDLSNTLDVDDGIVWGGPDTRFVLGLDTSDTGTRLVRYSLSDPLSENTSVDLTQGIWHLPAVVSEEVNEPLGHEHLDSWRALALSVISADMVGVLRRALDGAVSYSKERIAYGQPIGSFQAIQHLAAETHVTIEAAYGATCYASWCVDELEAPAALLAARTAKAYCASIARTAAENVMQIYGGVGQTWEHVAHFYTRRVLLDTMLFGDENTQLAEIARTRLEGT